MTLSDPLADANATVALLEGQLQAQGLASDHPRWTVSGELVLIADQGLFGDPGAAPADWVEARVLGIDGESAELRVSLMGDGVVRVFRSGECAFLVTRGRFPKG